MTLKNLLFVLPAPRVEGSDRFRCSGKLPTYPFPKLILTRTSHSGQNVGLREG